MTTNVDTTRETYGKMATEWYYQFMNDVIGPLSSRQLAEKVRSGQVKEDTLIRKDDSQWVPASQVNGLLEAVNTQPTQRICPYCGHQVQNPPTTCDGCNRKLVLSFNSRLTAGRDRTKSRQLHRKQVADLETIRERSDRADIIRYIVLLLVWMGLLFVAPYLVYLATTGKLIFQGNLAIVAALVISAFVGGAYYLISRLA